MSNKLGSKVIDDIFSDMDSGKYLVAEPTEVMLMECKNGSIMLCAKDEEQKAIFITHMEKKDFASLVSSVISWDVRVQ